MYLLLLGSLLAAPVTVEPSNFQLRPKASFGVQIVVIGQRISDQRLPNLPDTVTGNRGEISLSDHVGLRLRLTNPQRGRMNMGRMPRMHSGPHRGSRGGHYVGIRLRVH